MRLLWIQEKILAHQSNLNQKAKGEDIFLPLDGSDLTTATCHHCQERPKTQSAHGPQVTSAYIPSPNTFIFSEFLTFICTFDVVFRFHACFLGHYHWMYHFDVAQPFLPSNPAS